MSPEKQQDRINLQDGIDQSELNRIIELSQNSEEFSKNLKDVIEHNKDKRDIAENILISINRTGGDIIKNNRDSFKKLLDSISKIDNNIANSIEFKKWASIVDNENNFNLRKNITTSTNLKETIENKGWKKEVENLTLQDQELKDYLYGLIKHYTKRVESRQDDIQSLVPLYQLAAYGVTYDSKTGVMKGPTGLYNLFTIDPKTTEWRYNPVLINDKKALQLTKDGKNNIELTIEPTPTTLDTNTIKQCIGILQLENNVPTFLKPSIVEGYINSLIDPTMEEKNDVLKLISEVKRLQPTDAKKYDDLAVLINQLDTKEQVDKNNENGFNHIRKILQYTTADNAAEIGSKLFDPETANQERPGSVADIPLTRNAYKALFVPGNIARLEEKEQKALLLIIKKSANIDANIAGTDIPQYYIKTVKGREKGSGISIADLPNIFKGVNTQATGYKLGELVIQLDIFRMEDIYKKKKAAIDKIERGDKNTNENNKKKILELTLNPSFQKDSTKTDTRKCNGKDLVIKSEPDANNTDNAIITIKYDPETRKSSSMNKDEISDIIKALTQEKDEKNREHIDIAQGTVDQMMEARAVYAYKNNSIDDLKKIDLKKPSDLIKSIDDYGSYKLFAKLLKDEPDNFLTTDQRLTDYLAAIQKEHKESESGSGKKVDLGQEKMNGYYNVLADYAVKLAKKGDTTILELYLREILKNPTNIGADRKNQIENWNILAVYGDAFIKDNPDPKYNELKKLFLDCKSQLQFPPATITNQIESTLDALMERYGGVIGQVIDFFGGKGAFMKMLPKFMREKFLEKFQAEHKMSDKEVSAFKTLEDAFKTEIDTTALYTDKNSKTRGDLIIEGYKKNPTTIDATKEILKNNFQSLSPSLVQNLVNDINKKAPNSINLGNIVHIENNKPIAVRDNINSSVKDKILHQLVTDGKMRDTIKKSHQTIIDNSDYDIGTDKNPQSLDINGDKNNKGIGSFVDVTKYISAYVVTTGDKPLTHVMSENNIATSTDHRTQEVVNNPQKTPEQVAIEKHNEGLKKISEEINKTPSIVPATFDVKQINTTDNENKKYFDAIIKPIEESLSADKLDTNGTKTKFEVTASNSDLISAIKKNPQVIKDMITHLVDVEKDDTKKTNLTTVLSNIGTVMNIEKKGDTIQINTDNRNISIKAGPNFELIPQT